MLSIVVSGNFFLYLSVINPIVPIAAELILQFFQISLVICETEVFPFVPVTADIKSGCFGKKLDEIFDNKILEFLQKIKLIFFLIKILIGFLLSIIINIAHLLIASFTN